MIWPLPNDHPEDLASCKWSSGGTGLLQMIIRHPRHTNHLSQDLNSISRTFLEQFAFVFYQWQLYSYCAGLEPVPSKTFSLVIIYGRAAVCLNLLQFFCFLLHLTTIKVLKASLHSVNIPALTYFASHLSASLDKPTMKVTKFSGSHYLRSGLVSQMSTTSARVKSIKSQKHLSVSQWASYWQDQSIIGQLKVTFLDGRHLVRSIKRLCVLTWTLYSNLALPATSSLCTWINKISFFLLIWVKANLFCFSQTVIQQLKVVQNSGDLGRSESKKNGQVLITSPMRACWGESVLSSPPLLKSQRPNQAQRVSI